MVIHHVSCAAPAPCHQLPELLAELRFCDHKCWSDLDCAGGCKSWLRDGCMLPLLHLAQHTASSSTVGWPVSASRNCCCTAIAMCNAPAMFIIDTTNACLSVCADACADRWNWLGTKNKQSGRRIHPDACSKHRKQVQTCCDCSLQYDWLQPRAL